MKKLFVNFGLLIVTGILSILISELVAYNFIENLILKRALLNWRSQNSVFTNCYEPSDTLGFEPVWGKCGYPNLVSEIDKNGSQILGKKTEGYKILIIGDSNTARGEFDEPLKNNLNKIFKNSGKSFDVIKIGIESYNTFQEVELLRTKLVKLNPNIIILQFTTFNDFGFSPVLIKIGKRMVYYSSKGEKVLEINNFLFKNSSLYRLYGLNKILLKEKDLLFTDKNKEIWENKVKSMNRSLDVFKNLTEKMGISSLVLIYPVFDTKQPDEERVKILELLQEYNLDFIDLLPYTFPFGGPKYFQTIENGQIDIVHPQKSFDNIVVTILTEYVSSIIGKD